jgi:hypothetical protein
MIVKKRKTWSVSFFHRHLRLFLIFFFYRDQTCQSRVNDSVRDWRWFGLDGITKDNGHGLMDGMPKSGTTLGGYRRDQPLPIAFSRQPVGSIDVLSMKDCYAFVTFSRQTP